MTRDEIAALPQVGIGGASRARALTGRVQNQNDRSLVVDLGEQACTSIRHLPR
jgi:hypothetical protein